MLNRRPPLSGVLICLPVPRVYIYFLKKCYDDRTNTTLDFMFVMMLWETSRRRPMANLQPPPVSVTFPAVSSERGRPDLGDRVLRTNKVHTYCTYRTRKVSSTLQTSFMPDKKSQESYRCVLNYLPLVPRLFFPNRGSTPPTHGAGSASFSIFSHLELKK